VKSDIAPVRPAAFHALHSREWLANLTTNRFGTWRFTGVCAERRAKSKQATTYIIAQKQATKRQRENVFMLCGDVMKNSNKKMLKK
jgi:hypothetical protein